MPLTVFYRPISVNIDFLFLREVKQTSLISALHPRQLSCLWTYFIKPLFEGVEIDTALVWLPWRSSLLAFFRIGSNIRRSGCQHWKYLNSWNLNIKNKSKTSFTWNAWCKLQKPCWFDFQGSIGGLWGCYSPEHILDLLIFHKPVSNKPNAFITKINFITS